MTDSLERADIYWTCPTDIKEIIDSKLSQVSHVVRGRIASKLQIKKAPEIWFKYLDQ